MKIRKLFKRAAAFALAAVTTLSAVPAWGGLASGWKQSMKSVVTTNGEKSAEVIVPLWLQT